MTDIEEIILPSLEDILEKAGEKKREFEEEAMKIAAGVAIDLGNEMLLDTEGLLQSGGTVFVIPENHFQASGNSATPTEEEKERSMQIVVAKLESDGFNASYNQPKPDGDDTEKEWSINISKK